MILHKLIQQHLKHGDDQSFYLLQAQDAISWMEKQGVSFKPDTTVLDLGCGHGIFGAQLIARGCKVTFADEVNGLMPTLKEAPFHQINLDKDDPASLGAFDVVVCSNVLEHLAKPSAFLANA